MLGGFVLLNDPDLIRHVLIDNAANYPKDDLQLEKLTPAVGRGLLTAEARPGGCSAARSRRCFSRPASPRYLAAMAVSVDEMLARWEAMRAAGATSTSRAR